MIKCMQYEPARTQRETEISRGEGLEGTMGYEHTGCYSCMGYKKECSSYINKDLMNEIANRYK